MADWIEAVPHQGVTAGTRLELVYGAGLLQTPDPETVRFVVGGRPGFAVETVDVPVGLNPGVHVTGVVQTTGQLQEAVPMQVQVPVSDDPSIVGPGAILNLLGQETVARLERIRFRGTASVEQVEEAADEDARFREELGGELRDQVAEGQRRLQVGGVAVGVIAALALLVLLATQLTE